MAYSRTEIDNAYVSLTACVHAAFDSTFKQGRCHHMLSLRLLMSMSTVSGFLCSSSIWSCPGSSLQQHANRRLSSGLP